MRRLDVPFVVLNGFCFKFACFEAHKRCSYPGQTNIVRSMLRPLPNTQRIAENCKYFIL